MSTARGLFRGRRAALHPLRRPVDRAQSRAGVLLLLVLALAGPVLTGWAAGAAWSREAAAVRAQREALLQVEATLTEVYPPAGGNYVRLTWAEATWAAPDGSPRSGLLVLRSPAPAGAREPIWVDAAGRPVAEPPGPGDAAAAAVVAGLVAVVALLTGAAVARSRLGRRFDRRRDALWEAEWEAVEPQWTHRAG